MCYKIYKIEPKQIVYPVPVAAVLKLVDGVFIDSFDSVNSSFCAAPSISSLSLETY